MENIRSLDCMPSQMIRATVGFRINNIYKPKIPTVVAKLLQYSCSRVEHMDGFSTYK